MDRMTYQLNNPIQMLETLLLQNPRVHIILKMAIIKRNPDTIQTQARKILGVLLHKEIRQPPVKEIIVFLLPEHFQHRRSVRLFVSWVPRDEILHVQPAAQTGATEDNVVARGVDDAIAANLQDARCHAVVTERYETVWKGQEGNSRCQEIPKSPLSYSPYILGVIIVKDSSRPANRDEDVW